MPLGKVSIGLPPDLMNNLGTYGITNAKDSTGKVWNVKCTFQGGYEPGGPTPEGFQIPLDVANWNTLIKKFQTTFAVAVPDNPDWTMITLSKDGDVEKKMVK